VVHIAEYEDTVRRAPVNVVLAEDDLDLAVVVDIDDDRVLDDRPTAVRVFELDGAGFTTSQSTPPAAVCRRTSPDAATTISAPPSASKSATAG